VKRFELLEHTADVGIRVKGKDLKELFTNAASACFEIIAQADKPGSKDVKQIKIKQTADNIEELFINWLNELLSLSAAKQLIFFDFKIENLEENNLEATVIGSDMGNYKVNSEIKAATYHELRLKETPSGWQAEVILDV